MPDSPETYMKKVSAMCARPILSTREDREQFLRRLYAHWVRQLNLHNAGKPIQFNPLEVNEIIDAIDEMLSAIRKENS
jgi:hypothetical protein